MCTQQLTVTFEADRVGNPCNDRPQLRSHPRPPDTPRLMRPAVVQSALKPHAGGVPSDRDDYSLRNHLQGPHVTSRVYPLTSLMGLIRCAPFDAVEYETFLTSVTVRPVAFWHLLASSCNRGLELSAGQPQRRHITECAICQTGYFGDVIGITMCLQCQSALLASHLLQVPPRVRIDCQTGSATTVS